jgi:uncharacterized protein YeaO (DUF488 family)
MLHPIQVKRVYAEPSTGDGLRLLADRLWPRGLRKEAAALDGWLKDMAPSTELRKWFGHDPARWDEFRHRYAEELAAHAHRVEEVRALAATQPVTLLTASRDEARNSALVLRDVLLGRQ